MCGIVCIISKNSISHDILNQLNQVQGHRGPDASSYSIHKINDYNIGLAHQRLSILDLSVEANQPMTSFDYKNHLIFNGEIYNYLEIKDKLALDGIKFRTNSDTEVLLNLLMNYPLEQALNLLNGMFSFVWLDEVSQKLVIVRDRFGVKPLYYHISNEGDIFISSEIKTILSISKVKFSLNYNTINDYLLSSKFEINNETFFNSILKVPQSHYIFFDLKTTPFLFSPVNYWNLNNISVQSGISLRDAANSVSELFQSSIGLRMRSDVQVGALLSGGLDSSSIVHFMNFKKSNNGLLKIFSAVNEVKSFDESNHIREVLLNENLEAYYTNLNDPINCFNLIKKVTWHNDEPLGSFSNIAQYLMFKDAKTRGVKVILSGQGADEIFGGYLKYIFYNIFNLFYNKKYFILLVKTFHIIFSNILFIQPDFRFSEIKRFFKRRQYDIRGIKLNKLYDKTENKVYHSDYLVNKQILDIYHNSIPALTHYEDRMSMAHGVEVRNPFLDYRLVSYGLSLPSEFKLNRHWTKYILRYVMKDKIPRNIVWRRDKMGFNTPESVWVKGELKTKIEELLNINALVFRHKIIDYNKFLSLLSKYNKDNFFSVQVSHKEILGVVFLESWLQVFEEYIEF
jgi:asparagine synthase (glutamine-hydrolysing)